MRLKKIKKKEKKINSISQNYQKKKFLIAKAGKNSASRRGYTKSIKKEIKKKKR